MTVSSVTTFSLTGDQIVNAAMRKLGALGDGQSPSATQLTNGTQALNLMLKAFMAKGMPLWVVSEYDLTMTATHSFNFGIGQTVNIPAPLKVLQVVLVTSSGGAIQPLEMKTHYDYNLLSNEESTGTPTSFWYHPKNQVGTLYLWPIPDSTTISNQVARVVYQRPFYDQVSGSDTLDFPQWWEEAIVFGLALRLAPEFGLPLADRKMLREDAFMMLDEALSFGTEEGSLYLQPDWNGHGR